MDTVISSPSTEKQHNPLSVLEAFNSLREPRPRWLPAVVLTAILAVLLSACGGLAVSVLVYGEFLPTTRPDLSQAFVLFASILTIPYVGLHFRAAHKNHSLIRSQSFQHPLHSYVVLCARLAFGTWLGALALVAVAVALSSRPLLHLRVDLAISALGFSSILLILPILERAPEPFILPVVTPAPQIQFSPPLAVAPPPELTTSVASSLVAVPSRPIGPRPLQRSVTAPAIVPDPPPHHPLPDIPVASSPQSAAATLVEPTPVLVALAGQRPHVRPVARRAVSEVGSRAGQPSVRTERVLVGERAGLKLFARVTAAEVEAETEAEAEVQTEADVEKGEKQEEDKGKAGGKAEAVREAVAKAVGREKGRKTREQQKKKKLGKRVRVPGAYVEDCPEDD